MATNFPSNLDAFTNITDPAVTTTETEVGGRTHSEFHNDYNDAIEALEAKVGVDSSAVTTSHSYKIATLEAAFPSASVNNEMVLFSGTNGKVFKRSNDTWIVKVTSGVASVATPGTDYASAWSIGSSGLTMATSKLLWRWTASTGSVEEISLWSGLSLSAWTLSIWFQGASVYHSVNQTSSVTTNTWTTLAFDTERYDTAWFHDNITNNSRLTVSSGTYRICAGFYFSSATSWNSNWIRILKNGTTSILERALRDAGWAGSQDYSFDVSIGDTASTNDYYEVQIKSSASANMTVWGWTAYIAFEIMKN